MLERKKCSQVVDIGAEIYEYANRINDFRLEIDWS